MSASPVRVDARLEADVRALAASDDGAGVISQVDGSGARFVVSDLVEIWLDLDLLEAVLWVARSPATDDALSDPFAILH